MYVNFELTEFNIHLGLLENSAMVSVGPIDEYLKKCQSYYRLILKLLQRKKELMLNVYQMSSQFSQHIVSLIGKRRLIRISLYFKCSIACRTKRVRQFNFSSFARGPYEFQHFWWKSQEYCMLFKKIVSVDPEFFCWCQKNKNTRKKVFSFISKSRKVFWLTSRSPLNCTFAAVILSRKTLTSRNLLVL